MFTTNNIFIKFEKTFVEYFIMYLLNQKINFFKLITIEKKIKNYFETQILANFLNFKNLLKINRLIARLHIYVC